MRWGALGVTQLRRTLDPWVGRNMGSASLLRYMSKGWSSTNWKALRGNALKNTHQLVSWGLPVGSVYAGVLSRDGEVWLLLIRLALGLAL